MALQSSHGAATQATISQPRTRSRYVATASITSSRPCYNSRCVATIPIDSSQPATLPRLRNAATAPQRCHGSAVLPQLYCNAVTVLHSCYSLATSLRFCNLIATCHGLATISQPCHGFNCFVAAPATALQLCHNLATSPRFCSSATVSIATVTTPIIPAPNSHCFDIPQFLPWSTLGLNISANIDSIDKQIALSQRPCQDKQDDLFSDRKIRFGSPGAAYLLSSS
ncbi:hypothetical protein GGR50DRAFT_698954 [Xylaria sp. CBS 124048]|nr:hypothetical protein GGR50DRAFT_698954 [Xylaria sp. CBS 124048]